MRDKEHLILLYDTPVTGVNARTLVAVPEIRAMRNEYDDLRLNKRGVRDLRSSTNESFLPLRRFRKILAALAKITAFTRTTRTFDRIIGPEGDYKTVSCTRLQSRRYTLF
jgi:hypothetical protein